jgi:hypothetical protein
MITTPPLGTTQFGITQSSGAASLASSWTASSRNTHQRVGAGQNTQGPILDGRIIEAHPQCHYLVQSVCRRMCIVNSLFDRPWPPASYFESRSQRQSSDLMPHDANSIWETCRRAPPEMEMRPALELAAQKLILSDLRANSAIGAGLSACRTPARFGCGANSLIFRRRRSNDSWEKSPGRIANPSSSIAWCQPTSLNTPLRCTVGTAARSPRWKSDASSDAQSAG